MRYNTKGTFILGFVFGSILAIVLLTVDKNHYVNIIKKSDLYEKWFLSENYRRSFVQPDELRYGTLNILTEDEFLHENVNVLCVINVRKVSNANAINDTWGKYCNDRIFYSLTKLDKKLDHKLHINMIRADSSWHLLCELLRSIQDRPYQWGFFVNDDTFAIVHNLRRFLAPFDCNDNYYLGHAITFWGTVYNVAEAGYVLSRGAVESLLVKFNSSESCKRGGLYWKQDDFYLGKHLSQVNITPADTRDENGLSTFHGYNLNQLLFPGSITKFANYYKYSFFPTECCSRHSVTFQSVEADRMYMYHYLLYHLQIFSEGHRGNSPAPTPIPEDEVWKSFLREHNIFNYNISPEKYYELWISEVADPRSFNDRLRNANVRLHSGPSGAGYTNMPDVLSSLLNKYAHEMKKEHSKNVN